MDLNHEFTVAVAVDEAWKILTDVELIAPCLPGAQLQEIEGDTYRGAVKVKVGPILAQFKGQASFVQRDEASHIVILKGEGRDTTGKGNAAAVITAELTALTPTSTSCKVNTDLSVTGKVAQFGRGAMEDISNKILAQFVENLNTLIANKETLSAPEQPAASTPNENEVRTIDGPEVAPLNLLSTAGSPILKRAIPVVIVLGAVVVWLILR